MADLFRIIFCVLLIASAVVFAQAQVGSETAQVAKRQVAVTIDDVPGEAMRESQRCDTAAYRVQNIKMLEGFAVTKCRPLDLSSRAAVAFLVEP